MSSVVVFVDAPIKEVIVPRTSRSLDTDIAKLITTEGTAVNAAIALVSGTQAEAVPDSTASTVAAVVADLNALLAELRAAGVIAAS